MSAENKTTPAAALRTAAYHGDLTVVRHLVREGVDTNIPDEWWRTPLSLAAGAGHLEIVTFLVQNGAWVDPYDDYDTHNSPLSEAAGRGHLRIVQALIAAGANPQLHVGFAQATAEFYARTNGHPDVSRYLQTIMGIEGDK